MNATEAYLDIATRAHAEEQLIKAMERFGLKITEQDVSEVLRVGADTFLLKNEIQVPEKHLDEIYLILHEMREQTTGSSPNRTTVNDI